MRYKNVGISFFRFVTNQAFDRRTDSFLVTRPRCMQCMQHGKKRDQMLLSM